MSFTAVSVRRCRGEEGDSKAGGERQETSHLYIVTQVPIRILISHG
jgi:hypothetical protein